MTTTLAMIAELPEPCPICAGDSKPIGQRNRKAMYLCPACRVEFEAVVRRARIRAGK